MNLITQLTAAGAAVAALAALTLTPQTVAAQQQPQQRGSTALRGNVVVDGSSTVYPITEAVASEFRQSFPNVYVTVAISGTGGGMKRFVTGETDISNASRPMKPEEFKEATQNNVRFVELPVANDALTIVVNPRNDWLKQLSVEQLRDIFLERGNATRWSDLDPSFPNERINLFSPGTDSGTFDYFREVVVGSDGQLRPNMTLSEDDNVLVTGVAGDRFAIGYFGVSYYQNNRERLKAVDIVNPENGQAYGPSEENLLGGSYIPFSRPLFIYVNEQSLRRPEVRAFVDFYTRNAARLASQVDYVALTDEIGERAKEILRSRKIGTAFTDSDGKSRKGAVRDVYKAENLTEQADF